jgi:peptidoglycan/LPS O-acetylase OafA/YrhL
MSGPHDVDNADWLKTFAIILVVVGHTGYFFIEDAAWWSVFGRMAAPVFFFLMGYARSRTIPLHWIWLGVFLTLLDSWNNYWDWVPLNILFSMALIRLSRPMALNLLQGYGWVAFIALAIGFMLLLPFAGDLVDYGAEGWLWALFGLCQRMYVDSRSVNCKDATGQKHELTELGLTRNWRVMRLLACLITAVMYVRQEQIEFGFSEVQLAVVAAGVGILSYWLAVFIRGPSSFQPPKPVVRPLQWLGRHTLEIYVIQLAGSELIIKLVPELAA